MFTAVQNAMTRPLSGGNRASIDARPATIRTVVIAITVTMVAVLLPAALQSDQSGAVGPPAGCALTNAFEPSFSADSARVAFSAVNNEGVVARQIFVANIDGTSRSEIASESAGADPRGNRNPAFSPDGLKVAWDGLDVSRNIFASAADGSGRVNGSSTVLPDLGSNRHPRWSHDGARIIWYGNDAGLVSQIYVSNANGTSKNEISNAGVGTNPVDNERPVFNHDSTRVAWSGVTVTTLTGSIDPIASTAVAGVGTLFTTELMVGDTIRVNGEERVVASIGNDLALTVTLAFTDTGNDGSPDRLRREIYVADADGTNRSTVSSLAGPLTNNRFPEFDNDGDRIVWSGNNGSAQHIYIANAADGLSRVEVSSVGVGNPGNNITPRFSPDGTKLTWIGNNGVFDQVWVADVNGSNRSDITATAGEDPSGNSSPVWSPSGAKIAWAGIRTNGVQIWVADSDGSNRVEVSVVDDPGFCVPPPTTTTTPGATTTTTTSLPPGKPECPTGPTPFTDVSATSFALTDINCIYGLGITTGTSPTTYSPNDNVTREQMAAFLGRLWRTAGGTCPTAATPFTDVSATSFARADIACIFGLGITTGTSPTTYSPNDDVTREQMAAFLARVWRAASGTCSTTPAPFTDVSATSFARADINCIFALGITTGTSATTYSPNDQVTREQMAAFLGRLYRKLCEL